MANEERCASCKFFVPKYRGVGFCNRDVGQASPFWIDNKDSRLLVVQSFRCAEYSRQSDDISAETL